ncbi:MAG: MBOAT family protein [Phascolarctobacterium sp.]|nr:MBOAT family protein [Phascolarctobacterium sp.]
MAFNSVSFVFLFLPIVAGLYCLLSRIGRTNVLNILLIAFSLIFCWWGGKECLNSVIVLILFNFLICYLMRVTQGKFFLCVGVLCNLAFLAFFKYCISIPVVAKSFNVFIMPLGISFIVFHCISYLVDSYKENALWLNTKQEFINCCTYILYFPKLIQGPIVKYTDFKKQIIDREFNINLCYEGIVRFIFGLSKKTLFADELGSVVRQIQHCSNIDVATAWFAVFLYGLQLYIEFSAYSDMAIGVSKIFGFNINENFNFPYASKSITEFWRRWHISLGAWFKEYVYIPLGGNRIGSVSFNIFIVFLLTGVWHGNTKAFIAWGLIHGLMIVLERKYIVEWLSKLNTLGDFLGFLYTNLIVFIGWGCFRFDKILGAKKYFKELLGLQNSNIVFEFEYFLQPKILFLICSVILWLLLVNDKKIVKIKQYLANKREYECVKMVIVVLLFYCSIISILNKGYSPFIYFQF